MVDMGAVGNKNGVSSDQEIQDSISGDDVKMTFRLEGKQEVCF